MKDINKFEILAKVSADSDMLANATKTVTDREVLIGGNGYAVMYSCDIYFTHYTREGGTDEYGQTEVYTESHWEIEYTDISLFDLMGDESECVLTEQQKKELLWSLNNREV